MMTASIAVAALPLEATLCPVEICDGDKDGAANDWIEGTEIAQTFNGKELRDMVEGKAGNDTLNGDGGSDLLYGGFDNDTLNGGLAATTCTIGPVNPVAVPILIGST